MNVSNLKIIHIPRTGGTFLGELLKGLNTSHSNIFDQGFGVNTKIIYIKRNPFDWYGSIYNTHAVPNQEGRMWGYVSKPSFIECFKLINDKNKLVEFLQEYNIKDIDIEIDCHINSCNNYGYYTNSIFYYCKGRNMNTGDHKEIIECFDWIKERCNIIEINNLSKEIELFCNEYDIEYDKNIVNKKINSSEGEDYSHLYDEDMKNHIIEKERIYFEYFYPELLQK
jgi:hypothetical protein